MKKKITKLMLVFTCMVMLLANTMTAFAETDFAAICPYDAEHYPLGLNGAFVTSNGSGYVDNGLPKNTLVVYHLYYGNSWDFEGFSDYQYTAVYGDYSEGKELGIDWILVPLTDHYYIRDDAKNMMLTYPEELGWLPDGWHVFIRQIPIENGEYDLWNSSENATLAPDLDYHANEIPIDCPDTLPTMQRLMAQYNVKANGGDTIYAYTCDGAVSMSNEEDMKMLQILKDFAVQNEKYRAENVIYENGGGNEMTVISESVEETVVEETTTKETVEVSAPVKEETKVELTPAVVEEPAKTEFPMPLWAIGAIIGIVIVAGGIIIYVVVKK